MALTFTLAGERGRRGKTKGKTRVGTFADFGTFTTGDVRGAMFQNKMTKKRMNPDEKAIYDLNKELGKFPEMTEDARRKYRDMMVGAEQLRFMSMKTLAAALVIYFRSGDHPTPEMFTDANLADIIERILPSKFLNYTQEEQVDIYNKYKLSLFRYTRAILSYRQRMTT